MKKILVVTLFVLLASAVFTGIASAQAAQPQTGTLHEYMEKALAEKLGISLETLEAQFEAGKSLYQIALDNGIAQADLPVFMQEVRTLALQAAVEDGVITQAQADWMAQRGARGMGRGVSAGFGMMNRGHGMGLGNGPCGGTGVPIGSGMRGGFRWQQVNP